MNPPDLSYHLTIAARASTLPERIDEPWRFVFTPGPEDRIDRRIADWREAVAAGDDAMFARRCMNDRLDAERTRRVVGGVAMTGEHALQEWVPRFRTLMEFLCAYDPTECTSDMERLFGAGQERALPFIHLLTPLMVHAEHEFRRVAGDAASRAMTPGAERMRNLQAARLLHMQMGQSFALEFDVFRAARQSGFQRVIGGTMIGDSPDSTLYDAFVASMLEGGWLPFFGEYSALARIVTIQLRDWVRNSVDFAGRLDRDVADITAHLAAGVAVGRVAEFHGGISDAHDHGKSVATVVFESGAKCVYKPKALALERAWSDFIRWCNDAGLRPALQPLDVLDRGDYGWVGFIEAAGCASVDEAAMFYRRIGALIAIVYLMHGNDFHQENLIAAGAHPVPVDLESIMQHEGAPFHREFADGAMFMANEQFRSTVFRTGILPVWIAGKDGRAFDISGIGGYGERESPYTRLDWHDLNTDAMGFTHEPIRFQAKSNMPAINGEIQMPGAFREEIVEGFTAFHRFAIAHRDDMPLRLFATLDLRFIFRSTRVYGMILKAAMQPKFMREGVDRSIRIEQLCRAFLHTDAPNPYWRVSQSERRQMEDTDIPIFKAESTSDTLRDAGGVVMEAFMREAVYDRVAAHLAAWNDGDLERQVKLIRASLYFRDIGHGTMPAAEHADITGTDDMAFADQPALVRAAMDIARTLEADAIFSDDGGCSWITIGIVPGSERYRMQPMSPYLYDGLAGVAVFLSALEAVTGDARVRRLNGAACASLTSGIDRMERFSSILRGGPIGITSGLPSLVWSMLKIADFLGDAAFAERALRVGRMIDARAIERDTAYDIIGGSAGCLLAMLALHRATGDAEALAKARACGDHLIAHRIVNPDGTCAWRTVTGVMAGGFSHGAAGIAHALLALHDATGHDAYRDTAAAAIAYENTLYCGEHHNWRDLRVFEGRPGDGAPRFMTSWCHGAPGIGMARIAAAARLPGGRMDADIAAACRATLDASPQSADHLCCGTMGRVEFLLTAARAEGDAVLLAEAYTRAGGVIRRSAETGRYRLFGDADSVLVHPGLFQGVSGIGYEFLRLAHPERVPSVLLFE